MAASPPVKSVVAKTSKPTPIQRALIAAQKPEPKPAPAPVPPGYGVSGPGAPWTSPTYTESGSVLRHAPIAVDANGQAVSPVNDPIAGLATKAKPLPNAPAAKPKVKVQIHPDGTVSVTAHGHTQTQTPTPLASTAPAPAAATPGVKPAGGPHYFTTVADARASAPPDAPFRVQFAAGKGYYLETKPPRGPAASTTVTAPGGGPATGDAATARNTINSILAPVIKQIVDAENQRSTQGQQLISGYSKDAEDALKGIDFQSPYANAGAQESAINTALLARLTGAGSDLQNELAGKLGAANADPALAASIGQNIGAVANGAGNAGLAKGDATAAELLSEGANAKTYGNKLPGITALAGAQDVSKLLGSVANDQRTQLGDIESKVPQMVQSELTTLSNARTQAQKNRIAAAIAEGYDPATGQLTPKARAALASATGVDPMTGKPTEKTQLQIDKADAVKAKAALSSGKASAAVSRELGYLADDHGNPILRAGKTIPVATSGTKGFKISSSLATTLSKNAETYYGGIPPKYVPGSGGQVVPGTGPGTQLFYQDAISRLAASAIAGGMDDKKAHKLATAIANSYYKPGEGGRPTFTPKQQAANSVLFPDPLGAFGG